MLLKITQKLILSNFQILIKNSHGQVKSFLWLAKKVDFPKFVDIEKYNHLNLKASGLGESTS